MYSAQYGEVFLYGTLDEFIGCYKVRGEILYHDEDLCKEFGWTKELNDFSFSGNEEDYYIEPEEIEYPTWEDILNSLQKPGYYGSGTADMEETLKDWNPDLTKLTCDD